MTPRITADEAEKHADRLWAAGESPRRPEHLTALRTFIAQSRADAAELERLRAVVARVHDRASEALASQPWADPRRDITDLRQALANILAAVGEGKS